MTGDQIRFDDGAAYERMMEMSRCCCTRCLGGILLPPKKYIDLSYYDQAIADL